MIKETLFEMPPAQETKLERVKREHHIYTHFSKHMEVGSQWFAMKLASAEEVAQAPEIISRLIRRYDESGLVAEGETEVDAVIQLAKQTGLIVTL